jgi:hypothetical protein
MAKSPKTATWNEKERQLFPPIDRIDGASWTSMAASDARPVKEGKFLVNFLVGSCCLEH